MDDQDSRYPHTYRLNDTTEVDLGVFNCDIHQTWYDQKGRKHTVTVTLEYHEMQTLILRGADIMP